MADVGVPRVALTLNGLRVECGCGHAGVVRPRPDVWVAVETLTCSVCGRVARLVVDEAQPQ